MVDAKESQCRRMHSPMGEKLGARCWQWQWIEVVVVVSQDQELRSYHSKFRVHFLVNKTHLITLQSVLQSQSGIANLQYNMPTRHFAMAAALAVAALGGAEATCPTIKPVASVNFTEWVRRSWYIQQQQVTEYLPENTNYCVVATYGDEHEKVPDFDGPVIAVHNYANENEVNGPNENQKNMTLCARQPHNDSTALLVAPCWLPNVFAGDYWIVALGENDAQNSGESPEYTWAAVSGGQPEEEFPNGCTTKEKGVNGAGLWIFTREPVGVDAEIAAARDSLTSLGYTLSQLNNVTHEKCEYNGAIRKL